MDPVTIVGLVANGLQIAEMAITIISNLNRYFVRVRGARAQAKELRDEVINLLDILELVKEVFEQTPEIELPVHVQDGIENLPTLLRELLERTVPKKVEGIKRWTWPFRLNEIGEYIKKIDRLKATLNLILDLGTRFYSAGEFH